MQKNVQKNTARVSKVYRSTIVHKVKRPGDAISARANLNSVKFIQGRR